MAKLIKSLAAFGFVALAPRPIPMPLMVTTMGSKLAIQPTGAPSAFIRSILKLYAQAGGTSPAPTSWAVRP